LGRRIFDGIGVEFREELINGNLEGGLWEVKEKANCYCNSI